MMAPLDDWLAGLLLKLTPAERRAVNRRVVYELRRSQAQRIASQKNPDGTPYQPRAGQKNLRNKKGTIKRKAMFAKLRTQRHLRVRAEPDFIEVGFRGRDAAIASTHQAGSVRTKSGRRFVTPKRELLGLSDENVNAIANAYINYLAVD